MIKFKSNITWSISDKEKAKFYKVGILRLRSKSPKGILQINAEDIPHGFSVLDFIEFLVDNGIVIRHIRKPRYK